MISSASFVKKNVQPSAPLTPNYYRIALIFELIICDNFKCNFFFFHNKLEFEFLLKKNRT